MREFPHVDGVEHRFLDANGISVHVAEAGDREAEPLVLVHGWPQHWYEWRDLIPPLAERHRVICPDLRGFGWSEAPGSGYDPETFVADLVALLDELRLDRVRLVGHDWGGWAGFILSLRHPERVSRYLALNILHPFIAPSPRALRQAWRFWYQWAIAAPGLGRRLVAGPARFGNPVLRWVGIHPDAWSAEELEAFGSQFREPERVEATVALYRNSILHVSGQVARGRYRSLRLRTPTLLLFGTDDRVQDHRLLDGFEPYADEMRVELVPGAGHMIVDERPELVLDRAGSFLLPG